jgi:nicotinamidase-related amidase
MTVTATAAKPSVWSAPMPSFYDPSNIVWGYHPNLAKVYAEAHEWAKRHAVRPAAKDSKIVHVVPIDNQGDFCFPQGTLFVGGRSGRGAMDDSRRFVEWLYANVATITKITPTMDTHMPYQIFYQPFWEKADGSMVDAHTQIGVADIDAGTYRVSPRAAGALKVDYVWLSAYARHYCERLEATRKYKLYIWPFHCMLGSLGHALVGVIEEACMFHAFVRGVEFKPEIKGGNPLTENYSVLSPEVRVSHDKKWSVAKNAHFIETLLKADRVIIAGQASSHCVKSTIDDLLSEIAAKDPALAQKVYIMRDCMSAVVVPGLVDYTDEAEEALKKFADAGMHVVESTTPMDQWPNF